MYRYILFDLDGTLTDPKLGICTCVQTALSKMGIEEPDLDKLEPFIGPPLRDSFRDFYGMSDEDATKAIEYYRERFSTVGKFENEIYPGIPELLKDLKKKDKYLAIASSKPTVFVEDILEHFEIREYFDLVVGSELDGTRDTKEAVLNYTLEQMFSDSEIDYEEIVMIGDRKYDIEAAHTLGVGNIGVSYGYGSKEELEEAGADKIVNTVQGLRTTLLPIMNQGMTGSYSAPQSTAQGQSDKKQPNSTDWKQQSKMDSKKSFANTWGFIAPIVIYWIGGNAIFYVLMMLLGAVCSKNEALLNIVTNNAYAAQLTMFGTGCALAALFAVLSDINKKKKKIANAKESSSENESEIAIAPLFDLKTKCNSTKLLIYCASILLLTVAATGVTNNLDLWRQEAVSQYAYYDTNDEEAGESTEISETSVEDTAVSEVTTESTTATEYVPPTEEELNEAYNFIFATKYSWNFIIGFIIFGILVPLGESFIFIRFSYEKARSFMFGAMPIILVVLLYSFATANTSFASTVESIIGMIALFAAINAYNKTNDFTYSALSFVLAKALVWIIQSTESLKHIVAATPVFGICLILGVGSILVEKFVLEKKEKAEN